MLRNSRLTVAGEDESPPLQDRLPAGTAAGGGRTQRRGPLLPAERVLFRGRAVRVVVDVDGRAEDRLQAQAGLDGGRGSRNTVRAFIYKGPGKVIGTERIVALTGGGAGAAAAINGPRCTFHYTRKGLGKCVFTTAGTERETLPRDPPYRRTFRSRG